MTVSDTTASNLLGKDVSFKQNTFGETYLHRGIVSSVCLNLHGDHEILIDSDFFKLSEIQDLKIIGFLV